MALSYDVALNDVVVSNVKGGVGKTTTDVYLAAVAVARGYDPVLLLDADRQASAAAWLEERPIEGVTVIEAPSQRTLARAMRGRTRGPSARPRGGRPPARPSGARGRLL